MDAAFIILTALFTGSILFIVAVSIYNMVKGNSLPNGAVKKYIVYLIASCSICLALALIAITLLGL